MIISTLEISKSPLSSAKYLTEISRQIHPFANYEKLYHYGSDTLKKLNGLGKIFVKLTQKR